MNGKNKILVGCLVLLLVLSVGYALFSETIEINGTAIAKGNFELTTTILDHYEVTGDVYSESGIITDSDINVIDNVVTVSATLGAPGSSKKFAIKVENTGTIPAILKNITDENGNDALGENGYSISKCNDDNTTCMQVDLSADSNFYDDYTEEPYGIPEFLFYEDGMFESVLDPGESTYFYIDMSWSDESTSSETISFTYTFNLNWEQVIAS